jgi:hypothetical protein
MCDLPPHAITRIDTEDNTIRIARKRGDRFLPVSVIDIESLSTPRRSPCSALAILRIPDRDQITPVEALSRSVWTLEPRTCLLPDRTMAVEPGA